MTISDVYEADGNLLLQTDSTTGGTLYLGNTGLHTAVGPTTATATCTCRACGMPIGNVRQPGGATVAHRALGKL